MTPFPPQAYEELREGARRSAQAVVPLLLDLLRPASVADLGCGTGAWLAAFRDQGVADVLGLDGPHVETLALEVPRELVRAHDLTRPLRPGRCFDLALCLEVAEHLPPESAGTLIDSLAGLAPAVLFSAAVPGQRGHGHVNERWPDFWAGLFEARGYLTVDCLRERLWLDGRVDWWYAQNLLLFAREEVVAASPGLRRALAATRRGQLALVHPRCLLQAAGLAAALLDELRRRG